MSEGILAFLAILVTAAGYVGGWELSTLLGTGLGLALFFCARMWWGGFFVWPAVVTSIWAAWRALGLNTPLYPLGGHMLTSLIWGAWLFAVLACEAGYRLRHLDPKWVARGLVAGGLAGALFGGAPLNSSLGAGFLAIGTMMGLRDPATFLIGWIWLGLFFEPTGAAVAAACALGWSVMHLKPWKVLAMTTLSGVAGTLIAIHSSHGRLEMWEIALKNLDPRGTGAGTWPAFAVPLQAGAHFWQWKTFVWAHSELVQGIFELGWVGAAGVGLLACLTLFRLLRHAAHGRREQELMGFLGLACLSVFQMPLRTWPGAVLASWFYFRASKKTP